MSVLAGPIGSITFPDVVAFCDQQMSENVGLDYKLQIENEGLARTIAAMANTLGGVILIGVADDKKENKPLLPVEGMSYVARMEDRIVDIIWGSISPPLPVEVRVCEPVNGKTFVIVRVPQSNATPHAVQGNTEIYYRTNKGNHPEKLASVERIEWLLNQRRRAEEFKEELLKRAWTRYSNLATHSEFQVIPGTVTLSFIPAFPRDTIVRQDDIAKVSGEVRGLIGGRFDFPGVSGRPLYVQQGVVKMERGEYAYFSELTTFGSIYYRMHLGHRQAQVSDKKWLLQLTEVLHMLTTCLAVVGAFYDKLGYWGMVDARISLGGLKGVWVRRPRSQKREYWDDEDQLMIVDSELSWRHTWHPRDLADDDLRFRILLDLSEQIVRSFNFLDTKDAIAEVLSEAR